MTQQNNTTNWVIQDASGQQVYKFVQSTGKPMGSIMTSLTAQPVKLIKAGDTTQTFTPVKGQQAQMVKAISGSNLRKIPIGTAMAQAIQKGPDGQVLKKSIVLTPAQVQNLKLYTPTMAQKIQIQPAQSNAIKTTVINQATKTYQIAPTILDHAGNNRKRQESISNDLDFTQEVKRRKTEKLGKGLRHFSMKVCEKVRKKGVTSYNEVADELVAEFTSGSAFQNTLAEQYDQKNIRRRVYDALNVLMAMNIISKEKKEIKWLGLPSNSVQECFTLEKEKQKRTQRIRDKVKQLYELIMNQISFKNLVQRNREMEREHGPPAANSYIQLPFIVVHTNKKTVIDCSISHDKKEYLFHFNDEFEIQDDSEILRQIGMLMGIDKGECTPENLEKIKSFVPKSLEQYVEQLANGTGDQISDVLSSTEAGPSGSSFLGDDLLVSGNLDEENSHQSSMDPLSPTVGDYSEDEGDSDTSSDDMN